MRKVYLLSAEELREPLVYQEALEKLDQRRREGADRYRELQDRIRSVGAGLLLQFAACEVDRRKQKCREDRENGSGGVSKEALLSEERFLWERLEIVPLLAAVSEKRELEYRYGPDGKPYLADHSFQFSLSHSGGMVICAVSDTEVGADIQEMKCADYQKLVTRFFTRQEQEAFGKCAHEEAQRELFFRLWTRKEAYGKLTGKGLKDSLSRMSALEPERLGIKFEDFTCLPGYQACVCRGITDGDI